ncbi:MAG TPA: glutathione S-transferase family protein [Devosiaceae bacterium]|jgi:glutathione S-transferase|nr:glutathione S-transferase family protein [Devosiaceae bacterium]
MQLFVNRPSPYGRKALVAAWESGLADRIDIVQVDPWKDPPDLLAVSPAGKVPALVLEDGSVLIESTAICSHLMELGGRPRAAAAEWREETRRTGFAQALIDAAYAAVIERRRPPERQWEHWVERQRSAVHRLLGVLEVPLPDRFDLGDIGLACGLAYLDFRLPDIAWRQVRPDLATWLDRAALRPSMSASTPVG